MFSFLNSINIKGTNEKYYIIPSTSSWPKDEFYSHHASLVVILLLEHVWKLGLRYSFKFLLNKGNKNYSTKLIVVFS